MKREKRKKDSRTESLRKIKSERLILQDNGDHYYTIMETKHKETERKHVQAHIKNLINLAMNFQMIKPKNPTS